MVVLADKATSRTRHGPYRTFFHRATLLGDTASRNAVTFLIGERVVSELGDVEPASRNTSDVAHSTRFC